MQVQDSVRNDLMPLMQASAKTALDSRRSDAAAKDPGDAAAGLRRKAFGEMGRTLGLDFADVGSALRSLVARASGRERDAAPDVLSAVEAALQQTGKALRKAGFSDAQVDKALAGVREELGAAATASAELSSAQSTTYIRKDKANLAITTQEGDQVQIRFRNKEGVVSQTATSASGEERRVYAFSAGRIEISVKGDLNDEELAAISELVGKVESLAADFFAGDVQKAFEAATTLGFDAEQIAGFALKLSTRESLRQESIGKPAIAKPAPVPNPVIVPVGSTPEPEGVVESAPAAAVAVPVVPAAAAAPPESATSPEAASVQSTLGNYLRALMGSLQEPAAAGRLEFSMKWKLEVVVAAVESSAPKAGGTPASKLLSASLQELAKGVAAEPVSSTATPATGSPKPAPTEQPAAA
jgi:Holliday junction resolvasome RuvABC DNA-binding subunit